MNEYVHEMFSPYFGSTNLNIGCGRNVMPGWMNVDFIDGLPTDRQFDITKPWPLEDSTFDTVMAQHVLEHFAVEDLFHILWEAGRVLKLGGNLVVEVPYGYSDWHLACPFHKMIWTERTPQQFSANQYKEDSSSAQMNQGVSLHPWEIQFIYLSVSEEFQDKSEEEQLFARKHYLNAIDNLYFAMKLGE